MHGLYNTVTRIKVVPGLKYMIIQYVTSKIYYIYTNKAINIIYKCVTIIYHFVNLEKRPRQEYLKWKRCDLAKIAL